MMMERIALSDMDETEKFRHFFRIGLGRDPHQREIELCGSIAVLTQDPIAGFQEVWASIVLSSEFNR